MLGLAAILWTVQSTTPLDFGKQALQEAAGNQLSKIQVLVKPSKDKESYRIDAEGGKATIIGSDPVGAMYGAFEFAERLKRTGPPAWDTHVTGKPFLPERGLNLFLTLPWDYRKHDTDFSTAALTDPNRWWFQNDDYWTTLLNLMAKSRLNWLDIHGTWDISVTNAPNLYAYFVSSPTFPKVGVPEDVKAANLARLNRVVEMAHDRGIHVSLMAYEAGMRIPQNPNPPYQETEANAYTYTREVVEKMIRGVPGLDAIGFRIGESGKSESFFKCYGEAVKLSGRDIPLITRSWITRRQRVLPLARASKDFTVEIKYNGEQWGAPYPVAGGRMATWNSYSFEDYLSDAGDAGKNAKTWKGWPADGGGHWPDNPYKIVWQVRANGTHRIFPFYNPNWVRRSISAMKVGTASGYTIEGEDAYYPKSQDYYLANPADKYVDWIHQRDEMYWMTWGRLGYDPKTPDSVFDARVSDWFGSQGPKIAEVWKEASTVVPLAFMAYSLGPDHRDHAPELETGGDTQSFIDGNPFDPLVFQPIHETAGFEKLNLQDGRIKLGSFGEQLQRLAIKLRSLVSQVDAGRLPTESAARFKELKNSTFMLSDLAQYYGARFQLGMFEASHEADGPITPISRRGSIDVRPNFGADNLFEPFKDFGHAWRGLSKSEESSFYKPFTERLRMHTNTFFWSDALKAVSEEASPLAPSSLEQERMPMETPRTEPSVTWHRDAGKLTVSVAANQLRSASLLVKPLPSTTFFHKVPMVRQGDRFTASVPADRCGQCVALEVDNSFGIVRLPNFGKGEKPYIVIPAMPGPTPQIYGNEEAMRFLNPKVIDPQKIGTMLIAPRGSNFFRFDRTTKRKLLDPVKRGVTLIVMQQDFLGNRYPLDFLPKPLAAEWSPNRGIFDPGGLLGLPTIHTPEIAIQHFLPSEGWEIPGNGGVAHMHYGKGDIYVLAGRFMQRMTYPPAAQALKTLLTQTDPKKSVLLIDPGTEGPLYSTALYPDMMNALNVGFLTVGELIAREQGMNSFTPIPGPLMDDDVLGGKGRAQVDAFFRAEVQRKSARPTPKRTDFEAVRADRKHQLLRMLGLDPMPPKTPLNARQTGVLKGNGYHIEKIVFESRPKFYVTAHVYVPDGPGPTRRPVIVNVNGHWQYKKDQDRVQYRCQFQALQGYIAIAIDSPGHSFEGDSLIERRAEGEHDDYFMLEGGTNTTGYYVWDAIRGLDYIATRPDTDMAHVGITGASGGGLATLYTFAADDRYSAAVPVVYMSSMELAPDNGCLCNHVPGTSQIGDRSDVIGIQAPKPVYIMGAQNDGEFTPAGMNLTHKKMQEMWGLFGKDADTLSTVYPGGHDYNRSMREQMIGFFNKYLRGVGDGSPVPEPNLVAVPSTDRSLLVLDPPAADERTMRDLAKESLAAAPQQVGIEDVFRVNGGLPAKTDLKWQEIGTGEKRGVIFEAQPGLKIPGILIMPKGPVERVCIVVADVGKAAAQALIPPVEGVATLYLDTVGIGELSDIDMRYPVYLGSSVPFLDGWQIVRAAEGLRKYSSHILVVGRGPIASQAAMYAGLMDDRLTGVTGEQCLHDWVDVFEDGMPYCAVQPRANLCGSLLNLMQRVKGSTWTFRR